MKQFIDVLSSVFKKYPSYPVVVAFSGGVDSQVLLHLLVQAEQLWQNKRALSVCHVHHGLSKNADDWQSFAEQVCQQYDIDFVSQKVTLDLSVGESIEAQARDARYQALNSVYHQPSIILTGHHLNDQLETFLLALKRGAGVKGLSAMAEQGVMGKDILCRPLLSVPREEIECYAQKHQLSWVEDESNQDERYDRNYIRNTIVPSLESRWPSFAQTVARSAALCRESQSLVDELAEQDLSVAKQGQTLLVEKVRELSVARFNNLIRYHLANLGETMPSQAQLNALYQQLDADEDKVPEVKLGSIVVRRFQQQLHFTPRFSDISSHVLAVDLSRLTKQDCHIALPDELGSLVFSLKGANDSAGQNCFSINQLDKVDIKFNHANPKVLPDYRELSRPLKKVLQELKLAPWQRKRLPFIFDNEQLVAIPRQFVCKPYMADVQKFNVFVRWLEK